MAKTLSIACVDRSVRWYLTPGQPSTYDVVITNQSDDEHIDCTMALDDPAEGGSFEPSSFGLRPRERKTVTLKFFEDTQVPRDQRVLLSVRDANDIVIASFEHPLISAGGTDCTIALAWKEPIMDGDAVRGFVIACAIKSLSASAGQFALQFTPHPALEFVDVAPLKLEPGQTQTVAVPILWKHGIKDADGNDHPRVVEIGVAVSQGKRTGRLPWDVIEAKLAGVKRPQEVPVAQPPQPGPAARPAAQAQPSPSDAAAPAGEAAFAGPQSATTALAVHVPAPQYVGEITTAAAAIAASVEVAKPVESAPQPPKPTLPTDAGYGAIAGDDALMSLLVGKPVSPPAGWRGPGRDAPDAPAEPPSIFARTPPPVTPRAAQSPAQPPMQSPPQPATPPPVETPVQQIGQPARIIQPAQPAERPRSPESPVAPVSTPVATANGAPKPGQPASAFVPSELEASVVGPPPSLARAIEAGKEHMAQARRSTEMIEPPVRKENQLPTLVISGTAIIALALAVFFYLRPTTPAAPPQAAPSATVPPPVVLETVAPRPRAANNVKPKASPAHAPGNANAINPSIAPSTATRVAVQATERAIATNAPVATARPVATQRAAVQPTPVPFVPKPVRQPTRPQPIRHRPVPANPRIIVAIQGIVARYGPAGRAVRVLWGANGQASAHVLLTNDSGGILSETDVPGSRQNALLYLPRSYHGSVFVQVVSVGALGERVTQSTSLAPFSR